MTPAYRSPELLSEHHDLSGFQCRSAELTDWLRRYARQSANTGTTKVLVVTEHGSDRMVAYYAWCMAQITVASPRIRKSAGGYPQPVALLARLGVHIDHEGRGLAAGLLQDVFARLAELSERIGCRGLLVHAESRQARDFYLHLIPEFEPSPTDALHLVLLMRHIRSALRH